jgi:hypothetical protein
MPYDTKRRGRRRRNGPCFRAVQARAGARAEITIHDKRESLTFWLEKEGATMYELSVYPITLNLWRWEIRCGGALLRCGTAPTREAAAMYVNDVVKN